MKKYLGRIVLLVNNYDEAVLNLWIASASGFLRQRATKGAGWQANRRAAGNGDLYYQFR